MIICAASFVVLGGCPTPPMDPVDEYDGFANPQRVTIRGYAADAMEPFITPDGRYLLFNDSNDPAVDTNLHYAERVDDRTFEYRGEVDGANTAELDAVPSVDGDGLLYFISTRSYDTTLSTIYRARFVNGRASAVELVRGVSKEIRGEVIFDAEISRDGNTLYFADGRFGRIPVPETADLVIASRRNGEFRREQNSSMILRHVNTVTLEYAACVSADSLELFFTRLVNQKPRIYRAARSGADQPFGTAERVRAITGVVEAPALSPDGRLLYYHAREGPRFVIYRVSRSRT